MIFPKASKLNSVGVLARVMAYLQFDMASGWCYTDAMKLISLRLPDELHLRLKQRAAKYRRSLNSEILYILEQHLAMLEEYEEIESYPKDVQTLRHD